MQDTGATILALLLAFTCLVAGMRLFSLCSITLFIVAAE